MISALLTFLLEHGDLIDVAYEAISKGVSKDLLIKAMKDAMVAASDADMQLEFPNQKA